MTVVHITFDLSKPVVVSMLTFCVASFVSYCSCLLCRHTIRWYRMMKTEYNFYRTQLLSISDSLKMITLWIQLQNKNGTDIMMLLHENLPIILTMFLQNKEKNCCTEPTNSNSTVGKSCMGYTATNEPNTTQQSTKLDFGNMFESIINLTTNIIKESDLLVSRNQHKEKLTNVLEEIRLYAKSQQSTDQTTESPCSDFVKIDSV